MDAGTQLFYNPQSRHTADIKTSVLYVAGKPALVTLDYVISTGRGDASEFRLSYYPHKLAVFEDILKSIFADSKSHEIYGDFKPLTQATVPAFYIHVVKKND